MYANPPIFKLATCTNGFSNPEPVSNFTHVKLATCTNGFSEPELVRHIDMGVWRFAFDRGPQVCYTCSSKPVSLHRGVIN